MPSSTKLTIKKNTLTSGSIASVLRVQRLWIVFFKNEVTMPPMQETNNTRGAVAILQKKSCVIKLFPEPGASNTMIDIIATKATGNANRPQKMLKILKGQRLGWTCDKGVTTF